MHPYIQSWCRRGDFFTLAPRRGTVTVFLYCVFLFLLFLQFTLQRKKQKQQVITHTDQVNALTRLGQKDFFFLMFFVSFPFFLLCPLRGSVRRCCKYDACIFSLWHRQAALSVDVRGHGPQQQTTLGFTPVSQEQELGWSGHRVENHTGNRLPGL